jgi:hypothetical protein
MEVMEDIVTLATCLLEGIYSAAWETLSVLGYPGRP